MNKKMKVQEGAEVAEKLMILSISLTRLRTWNAALAGLRVLVYIPCMRRMPYFLFLIILWGVIPVFGLQIYRTGSPVDVNVRADASVCLAGGGLDDDWADGWRELLEHANQGDVVILRADGQRGGYENWLYQDESRHGFPRVNSVTTVVIESSADANRPEVIGLVRHAELLFFAGGDQSYYLRWIRNSALQRELMWAIFQTGVAVGGTSAGMAILGGVDFTARYGSPYGADQLLTSEQALQDPLSYYVDLDTHVLTLPYLQRVVTDTHFSERGREGRLVAFLAKSVYQHLQGGNWFQFRAMGVDEGTAFCYGMDGRGHVFGKGSAYLLRVNAPIEKIMTGQPLFWYGNGQAISVQKMNSVDRKSEFDLSQWRGLHVAKESWWVDIQGVLHRILH